MARSPRPFSFTLTEEEAVRIRGAVGQGGFQTLHRKIVDQLANGLVVNFTDDELGELLRYMSRYKSGGFQSRLRSAFGRSLRDQLGF
jgi:hypothetical protein